MLAENSKKKDMATISQPRLVVQMIKKDEYCLPETRTSIVQAPMRGVVQFGPCQGNYLDALAPGQW